MKPSFPEDRIDLTKSKEKNSLFWNKPRQTNGQYEIADWINNHTLLEDLSCPLHEVQRAWIRKPISILMLIILVIPAIFLSFIVAVIEFFLALRIYLRAAIDTYKGQKAV